MGEESSFQLIDKDGIFNTAGIENFTTSISECGLSYAVLSIMGPQSSGKSTLLNHLFKTNFREMDAYKGRSQTTKGIWLAKCVDITPCTVVMDMEGTDGRERGEDDTVFEKQSALFALAVSDIVLINMWCHDIGREQAANKPLLKTVFQVMMQLFRPRRINLLFIIRDKTRTPLETLEPILREDIQKIWDTVSKPEAYKAVALSDFFIVDVVALPSYEEKEEQFKEQVASLRKRLFNSIAPRGLARDNRGIVPASGFSFSLQEIWKIIKENKDLDLPTHKVMVSTVRCEGIAHKILETFSTNEDWLHLARAAKTNLVVKFGMKVSLILDSCLLGYDMDSIYFDEHVRTTKREYLEFKLLELVRPAYQLIIDHLCSRTVDGFKQALDYNTQEEFAVASRSCTQLYMSNFDKGCADAKVKQANWDISKVRDKLKHDIYAHICSVRCSKLAQLTRFYEERLKKALRKSVGSLLIAASDDTWPAIRNLLDQESNSVRKELSIALSAFDIDVPTTDRMLSDLDQYARNVVETKAKEESEQVLKTMKDRFATIFSYDSDSMPRVWTRREDIRAITRTAQSASLKLLSVVAAIRLDEEADNIEETLLLLLLKPSKMVAERSIPSDDPLALATWEMIAISKTLLSPIKCSMIWRQFIHETRYIISHAIIAQESHRANNSRLPLAWAMAVLMFALGFKEFMSLLRNPMYIGVLFIAFLILKAVWIHLDISRRFQHLPGIISLCTTFIPTIINFRTRLEDECAGQRPEL